ncbi:DeoR/GlpR family DNA-binding transcription regulator [Caloramator sp. ALD01]|uniref:DeoR/GlpR family DNA-binding transcription regulator n=1 Tax=Caloramator sp. ALD01 TaxID=1031288 RepID=UPI00041A43E5|nr:DeoR/GlpR family DNA-binding transcription regulator [Caloramator sp. ALD01]
MFQEERMQHILEYLQVNKRISVEEICKLYNVSRDTARRDLVNLEKKGLIVRTHGGAILPPTHERIKPYKERLHFDVEEKHKIAKVAASLIKEGDTVILDTSTTVQACAELMEDINCNVITNSINVADVLSAKVNVNTILLGGKLNQEHRFLYGHNTINMLSNYFADKAFLGALAITKNGIFVADDEDAAVMQSIIKQSKETIVLADHTKFSNTAAFRVCSLSEIDIIITDKSPNEGFIKTLKENGVNLIIAK